MSRKLPPRTNTSQLKTYHNNALFDKFPELKKHKFASQLSDPKLNDIDRGFLVFTSNVKTELDGLDLEFENMMGRHDYSFSIGALNDHTQPFIKSDIKFHNDGMEFFSRQAGITFYSPNGNQRVYPLVAGFRTNDFTLTAHITQDDIVRFNIWFETSQEVSAESTVETYAC